MVYRESRDNKNRPNMKDSRSRKDITIEIRKAIQACHSHAQDLLRSSKRILKEEQLPNIAYHLAALGLEEMGKSMLWKMISVARERGDEKSWMFRHMEDHVKKLHYAFWLPLVGHQTLNQKNLTDLLSFAQNIHETRIRGLYVSSNLDEISLPKDLVTEAEANRLISLLSSLLEIEKIGEPRTPTKDEEERQLWFLQAAEDDENRKVIFSKTSMDKLVELKQVPAWVEWLKERFMKAEQESMALVKAEMERSEPGEEEAAKDKWRFKLRLYSGSHKSIRQKSLNRWNDGSKWIKLYAVNGKPRELIAVITLQKAVPVQGLYWLGWGISRAFVTALNIATFGLFFWYLPNDISRYYDGKIRDLENNSDVVLERNPSLQIDFQRDLLTEEELWRAIWCFVMLTKFRDNQYANEVFGHYFAGLAFLAKTDIHLQFEPSIYINFHEALKKGMRLFNEWDGQEGYESLFRAFCGGLHLPTEQIEMHLALRDQLERREPNPKITLKEAGEMKVLCDAYFLKKAKEMYDAETGKIVKKQEGMTQI